MKKFAKPLITSAIIILFLFAGCTDLNHRGLSKELSDMESKIAYQPEVFLTDVVNDHFNITATINYRNKENVEHIIYEMFIEQPKVEMEQLQMSFHLHPQMLSKIGTTNIFESNVLFDNLPTIAPHGTSTGASLFRAFLLDPSKVDRETLEIYTDLYVKVSYQVDREEYVHYFKLNAEPSEELVNVLHNTAMTLN
ncbi:hypothetical protein [Paenibacillus xylanexedens]|uniref:hypothetical protein n=1 Tax=Paenibacillus xylanexedens TaxID=528191 RepID=UPI00119FAA38|nr:hypothetical protein [Paenibacillus xylanexedens]